MHKTLPRYKKLHLDLKRRIVSGDIAKGTFLPSENELSATYKITRATVRQGLEELVKEGFIEKQIGVGSVVISNRRTLGLLTFKGFSEVMESTAFTATTNNLNLEKVDTWPTPFFYKLSEIEEAMGCFFLERLRRVEEVPVMLEYTYVPRMGFDRLLEKLQDSSLFTTLQKVYGVEILKVLQDIRAVNAPETVLERLNLSAGAPLLHIHRKYLTNRKDLHVYSSLYCNTEKYAISNFFN